MTDAVAIMPADDPRHGTVAGYVAHAKFGGPKCEPCRKAAALYEYNRQARRYLSRGPLIIDGTGTRRRVQALVAIGWTMGQLDDAMGKCRGYTSKLATSHGDVLRVTAQAVAALYGPRCMTSPVGWVADRQRRVAVANDWPTPMAWDDIDDPAEKPAATYRPVLNWPRDELVAEWDHLRGLGVSAHMACRQLGVTFEAIEKAMQRQDGAA